MENLIHDLFSLQVLDFIGKSWKLPKIFNPKTDPELNKKFSVAMLFGQTQNGEIHLTRKKMGFPPSLLLFIFYEISSKSTHFLTPFLRRLQVFFLFWSISLASCHKTRFYTTDVSIIFQHLWLNEKTCVFIKSDIKLIFDWMKSTMHVLNKNPFFLFLITIIQWF